jgi:hypothetical protein
MYTFPSLTAGADPSGFHYALRAPPGGLVHLGGHHWCHVRAGDGADAAWCTCDDHRVRASALTAALAETVAGSQGVAYVLLYAGVPP